MKIKTTYNHCFLLNKLGYRFIGCFKGLIIGIFKINFVIDSFYFRRLKKEHKNKYDLFNICENKKFSNSEIVLIQDSLNNYCKTKLIKNINVGCIIK